MKQKTFAKVLSLALAALMLFALCACGTVASSPAAEPTAAPAADAPASEAPAETEAPAESQGVLDQIKADGVLYVTLSPDFAPIEFVDSSKDGQEQYVGFDVTLAKYIADYIGVDLVIEPMSFDACQTAVYTGSVPMSISGYSWTEERSENYEISDYYYAGDNETEQVILIKKTDADKYTSAEDFSGVDVGAPERLAPDESPHLPAARREPHHHRRSRRGRAGAAERQHRGAGRCEGQRRNDP